MRKSTWKLSVSDWKHFICSKAIVRNAILKLGKFRESSIFIRNAVDVMIVYLTLNTTPQFTFMFSIFSPIAILAAVVYLVFGKKVAKRRLNFSRDVSYHRKPPLVSATSHVLSPHLTVLLYQDTSLLVVFLLPLSNGVYFLPYVVFKTLILDARLLTISKC